MKIMSFQASVAAALMLAAAWLASPVSAQTQSPPATPVQSTAQPAAPAAAPSAAAPAAAKPDAAVGIAPAMKELSPWVMFQSADIIVKAVMIGLAFASLMTWTVLIAKSIELSVASTKLRSALKKIAEARSLAEAQMALGSKEGILPSFLAAALREARMSAGLSSDTGIKERAASSFSEIVRAEARRIRVGMGVLATIGSTSPFVGLFGTVWGIMNSFIGISKSQTTNLAVVAPGIAEALLATAIGLVAAIPAVIIYNYFSRVTKSYLELVSRASGAAGRLLSRDLDRSHGSVHSRAAE
ncbi:biopolymer transport protein ExbB [Bradyrhizobium sp. LB1.3]|jgi:biopolymer transport protein ExbB|uniref:tonB-system energizer ExbB n=1 Tax=Bradyrhizobium sp. 197 TaxID=2782663 RepID=UPI001FF8F951|nr:tonB-system energizer ExbB [Bradyrhizobium sp. 197]MCK1479184.1 tonB-system energizer ExbB [Bradyrhizobium sp. 197]